MEKESDNSNQKEPSYAVKVWQTTAIVCLAIIAILILRVAFNILLMALAGVLIAVYFHGLAELISAKTKIEPEAGTVYFYRRFDYSARGFELVCGIQGSTSGR